MYTLDSPRRRDVAAGTLLLLAGCTASSDEDTDSDEKSNDTDAADRDDDSNRTDDSDDRNDDTRGEKIIINLKIVDIDSNETQVSSRESPEIRGIVVFDKIYDFLDELPDGNVPFDGTIAFPLSGSIESESEEWQDFIDFVESTDTHVTEQDQWGALINYEGETIYVTYDVDELE